MDHMDRVIDQLDIAAKDYPMKALAPELGKGESTLRNELTFQPGYKLGLLTALLIMKHTGNLRALDTIEGMFGRVAFDLPRADGKDPSPIMQLVGRLSVEFGEHMEVMGKALDDCEIEKPEAKECLRELNDVITACVKLKAYLQALI